MLVLIQVYDVIQHLYLIYKILKNYTQDTLQGNFASQKTGMNDYNFIHDDLELEKNVPSHFSRTNASTRYENNLHHEIGHDLQRALPQHSSQN